MSDHRTIERAIKWLAKKEASIQGQKGSASLMAAAGGLAVGFALDETTAIDLLLNHFNPRCQPPWSLEEIKHKVNDAIKNPLKPAGYLLNGHAKNGEESFAQKLARIGTSRRIFGIFASKLGLPWEVFRDAKINSGEYKGANYLYWPEVDASGAISGMMRRPEKGKAIMLRGGKRGIFLPCGWQSVVPGRNWLFVSEGASDSLALFASGLRSVARPSKSLKPAATARILAALIAKSEHSSICILADSDDATPTGNAAQTAACLAAELSKEGMPAGPWIVRWATSPGGSKDARSWLTGRPVEEAWSDRGAAFLAAMEMNEPPAIIEDPQPLSPNATQPLLGVIKKPWEQFDDPAYLAREFLETVKHADRPRLAYFRGQFQEWNGTHWQIITDDDFRVRINKFAKTKMDECFALLYSFPPSEEGKERPKAPKVTPTLVTAILQAVAGMVVVGSETPCPSWIGSNPKASRDIISLTNGLVDVQELLRGGQDCLRSHSPLWFSPIRFPYDFDPDADCPTWRAFLNRNLDGELGGKTQLLQQWFGYMLTANLTMQKFLFLIGEGANGKSVICAVLRAMLGEENCSAIPLEMFGSRFSLETTIGKLANLAAEVGELDKVAEGQLKAFTAGDLMQFERKFKSPYMAVPTARLVLSTNTAPDFRDKSDGLWRRMLVIRMITQIPEGERVPGMDLPSWWSAKGELPGILNWAIAGLAKLREAGRFVIPTECRLDNERLRGDANPAKRFLNEHYQIGEGYVEKKGMYKRYREWCSENGHHPMSSNKLASEVYRLFPTVKEGRPTVMGARLYTFNGIEEADEG